MDRNLPELVIHAKVAWQQNAVDLFLAEHRFGALWLADPLIFREMPPASTSDIPTVRLSQAEAQVLMDQLWNCGVRPTEGNGSAGQAAATAQHLKDMREIAFGALKRVGLL